MRLARSPHLDALIGAYVVGTLRGGARRRFERALRDEPWVASRYAYFQRVFALRYAKEFEVKPSAAVWSRLSRSLELSRFATPWWRRASFLRGWAAAATAALVIALGLRALGPQTPPEPQFAQVAVLAVTGAGQAAVVNARLSADGRSLQLVAERPVEAGAAHSYELWLIPPGGKPESMAVLGRLDARFALAPGHIGRVTAGAQLAISVEPAGGSPTGAPTGPVILAGAVKT
jgi:anti-sigma-K factor RskA